MKQRGQAIAIISLLLLGFVSIAIAQEESKSDQFTPIDIFQLEYASDPQISPDGTKIVYVRNSMDIMKDQRQRSLWIINANGSEHRPLASGGGSFFAPRWSPDGKQLLYASTSEGSVQLYVRWMDTGQTAKLTHLLESPSTLTWSPDGNWIAFTMMVPAENKSFAKMPKAPKGAKWAPSPKFIDGVTYRIDGSGYVKNAYRHIFVLPKDGGTPRQLSTGNFNHDGSLSWSRDSQSIIFSANRDKDWEYQPVNSEIYELSLSDGSIKPLTSRNGPDSTPRVSPDGKSIAYLGFDDKEAGYQVSNLYIMNRDGTNSKLLLETLDRDVSNPTWSQDGKGLYFQYDDQGDTKLAYVSVTDKLQILSDQIGGTSIGRPYGGGSFSVSNNNRFAFTKTTPMYPADIAVGQKGSSGKISKITSLNKDLFTYKKLATVEEIWYESSHDGRKIQGWIAKPPRFDPQKTYPLILEIHGGPFANYGNRFSSEVQLYASAGYVVLYINPRGSTSYGAEFGNLIHHNYPGEDYDDLISGVDAVIAKGYVDKSNLFVTGGSGGGVLTSWIIGKTDRFRAAVVAKPVINWTSFALTSDFYTFFHRYWFPGKPWDHMEHYWKRSPLSLVGNVKTPTMLLTGESDYRTPISESEQYYQALKIQKVDTAMVRIPGASHGIAARPSNLIAKVVYILQWFEAKGGPVPE